EPGKRARSGVRARGAARRGGLGDGLGSRFSHRIRLRRMLSSDRIRVRRMLNSGRSLGQARISLREASLCQPTDKSGERERQALVSFEASREMPGRELTEESFPGEDWRERPRRTYFIER